jgi:hypothetical protein
MILVRARGIFFARNRGNKALGRHSTHAKINDLSVGAVHDHRSMGKKRRLSNDGSAADFSGWPASLG